MRIDLPCCGNKLCRKSFDGNCIGNEADRKDCEIFISEHQKNLFDVDKVVELLTDEYINAICENCKPCNYPNTIGCCYDKAIKKSVEIAKGGGQG